MLYLTVDEVTRIHDLEIPGAPLTNRATLESAVAAIAQGFDRVDMYPTIHTKAAVLMSGVAAAHGFLDGNKRTALIATFTFYAINGWYVDAPELDLMHVVIDAVVDSLPVVKIAGCLEQWAAPVPDDTQGD